MRNILARLGALDVFMTGIAITDVSTSEDVYVVAPVTGVIKEIQCAIQAAITVADTAVTVTTKAGLIAETLTLAYTGSAPGSVFTKTFARQDNRKVVKGQVIKIACDGGSTTTSKGKVTLILERTRV